MVSNFLNERVYRNYNELANYKIKASKCGHPMLGLLGKFEAVNASKEAVLSW